MASSLGGKYKTQYPPISARYTHSSVKFSLSSTCAFVSVSRACGRTGGHWWWPLGEVSYTSALRQSRPSSPPSCWGAPYLKPGVRSVLLRRTAPAPVRSSVLGALSKLFDPCFSLHRRFHGACRCDTAASSSNMCCAPGHTRVWTNDDEPAVWCAGRLRVPHV